MVLKEWKSAAQLGRLLFPANWEPAAFDRAHWAELTGICTASTGGFVFDAAKQGRRVAPTTDETEEKGWTFPAPTMLSLAELKVPSPESWHEAPNQVAADQVAASDRYRHQTGPSADEALEENLQAVDELYGPDVVVEAIPIDEDDERTQMAAYIARLGLSLSDLFAMFQHPEGEGQYNVGVTVARNETPRHGGFASDPWFEQGHALLKHLRISNDWSRFPPQLTYELTERLIVVCTKLLAGSPGSSQSGSSGRRRIGRPLRSRHRSGHTRGGNGPIGGDNAAIVWRWRDDRSATLETTRSSTRSHQQISLAASQSRHHPSAAASGSGA